MVTDGFINDEKVLDFYFEILYNIKDFFEKNGSIINQLNKQMNIDLDIKLIRNKEYTDINKKRSLEESKLQINSPSDDYSLTEESELNRSLIEV